VKEVAAPDVSNKTQVVFMTDGAHALLEFAEAEVTKL
jgi:hypothetical protein